MKDNYEIITARISNGMRESNVFTSVCPYTEGGGVPRGTPWLGQDGVLPSKDVVPPARSGWRGGTLGRSTPPPPPRIGQQREYLLLDGMPLAFTQEHFEIRYQA